MGKKPKYYIDSKGEFVVENYNLVGPFSNFLPGIAGLFGIPMWAFYVNRGQCLCSFGVKSKDSPIMEYLPANRAYQLASSQGFRTFIKLKQNKKSVLYEPFQAHPDNGSSITQKMFINPYELRIQEVASHLGLETEVTYFTIPNESFAALARVVTLKNVSKKDLAIDMLDGTPLIVPCGSSNFFLQKMRRTLEAWMLVENMEKGIPFYRLKVDPSDISEVTSIEEGNFYLSLLSKDGKKTSPSIFIDPKLIFGERSDFSYPTHFLDRTKLKVPSSQMQENKLPCAMSLSSFKLKKASSITLYSLIGHMASKEKLNSSVVRLNKPQFFINKREENKNIIKALQQDIFTSSNERQYDFYCGQTFLDNVLRGGYPVSCGKDSPTFYTYSRKHGDLERDYNRFYIDPTYFSQGNGNFRDMNQNRRNDIFFNPDVKDSNILHFYSLLQSDGFNPLVLHGLKFKLKKSTILESVLKGKLSEKDIKKIEPILKSPFTPGELFMDIEKLGVKIKGDCLEFLSEILKNSSLIYEAEHAEGFWVDHWTYNLDLVESYLSIYPEKLREILLDKKEFTFYDNAFCVKPRSEKYLLNGNNSVRQYHSLVRDGKKDHLIKKRNTSPNALRMFNGEGQIYRTTLLVKMLCLIINKLASLGPCGVGIEMEADKPGWCDSMNGLPALFGSSMPEVFELKKEILFILDSLETLALEPSCKIHLPKELYSFLKSIEAVIGTKSKASGKKKDFSYWDKASTAKEKYREKTKLGFDGTEKESSLGDLEKMLKTFLKKVDSSIKKAYIPNKNIYPTYFINEVSGYKELNKRNSIKNLPLVKPTAFKSVRLPLFLEGVVRAMKVEGDTKKIRRLYSAIKKTKLYDKKLKMYRLNESLKDVSKEVGRSRIFTPGWLENESIWLHMEYKYLLEILKSGLYGEFFEEFKNVLIPFQNPEVYGRSISENSSFIVSSAFPDEKLHGKGFVARLSGSTAEMLSIWILMNVGKNPFFLNEKEELCLKFRPSLPAWLFTERSRNGFPKKTYAFKFLGKTQVVYHNPRMKNTVGKNSVRTRFIVMKYYDGKKIEIKKDVIGLPYSRDARDRKVKKIDIYLG